MYNILICDDERDIRRALSIYLAGEGYGVLQAENGKEAVDIIADEEIHLVLMDIMMPVMDGMVAMTAIRQKSNIPVILLTAQGEDMDKVAGLTLGADDYVTKPFGTAELMARIRIALRHSSVGGPDTPTGKAINGALTIDYDKRRVYVNDQEIHLTQIEYKIVMLTMLHIGKVLTYDFIIRSVWGARPTVNNQILRVNMANIRRKIEANPADPQFIITETGVGYRMIDHDDN